MRDMPTIDALEKVEGLLYVHRSATYIHSRALEVGVLGCVSRYVCSRYGRFLSLCCWDFEEKGNACEMVMFYVLFFIFYVALFFFLVMLDAGCWMLDAGCWNTGMLWNVLLLVKTEMKIEINRITIPIIWTGN
ncbi:hypothetical protein BZA77DRAFT_96428 [Pyronema omphalodes]|nr:hypothetical protein BZA77DRAFT_96428 [Pyronema omphalodes]